MVKPHIYRDIYYNYDGNYYMNPPPHSPQSIGWKWKRKYWDKELIQLQNQYNR